jgi:hypothetical protein
MQINDALFIFSLVVVAYTVHDNLEIILSKYIQFRNRVAFKTLLKALYLVYNLTMLLWAFTPH